MLHIYFYILVRLEHLICNKGAFLDFSNLDFSEGKRHYFDLLSCSVAKGSVPDLITH